MERKLKLRHNAKIIQITLENEDIKIYKENLSKSGTSWNGIVSISWIIKLSKVTMCFGVIEARTENIRSALPWSGKLPLVLDGSGHLKQAWQIPSSCYLQWNKKQTIL